MTREYFAEGEYVPGSPAQPYYYGPDQIGSVRRVFASTASAPAYSYDPYGNALQGTAPLTDFNYAGMFYNADSGLYLTQYRAYDPVAGRWLSRDPLGEMRTIVKDGMSTSVAHALGSTVPLIAPDDVTSSPEVASENIDWPFDAVTQAQPIVIAISPKLPPAEIASNYYDFGNGWSLYQYVKLDPISQVDTNGLQLQLLGPGGGGRICGFIVGGFGFRMDYAPNPGPTLLHFHAGPLSAGPSWGGHRPWYAPWQVY